MAVGLADGADAADAEEFMVNLGEGLVKVTHSLEAWKVSPQDLRVGEVSKLGKVSVQGRDDVIEEVYSTSLKLRELWGPLEVSSD